MKKFIFFKNKKSLCVSLTILAIVFLSPHFVIAAPLGKFLSEIRQKPEEERVISKEDLKQIKEQMIVTNEILNRFQNRVANLQASPDLKKELVQKIILHRLEASRFENSLRPGKKIDEKALNRSREVILREQNEIKRIVLLNLFSHYEKVLEKANRRLLKMKEKFGKEDFPEIQEKLARAEEKINEAQKIFVQTKSEFLGIKEIDGNLVKSLKAHFQEMRQKIEEAYQIFLEILKIKGRK